MKKQYDSVRSTTVDIWVVAIPECFKAYMALHFRF
jgi:hypothetical protein